jgi:hypothetical protein
MTVEIASAGEDRVSVTVGRKDLHTLLAYFMHAKFSDEIKVYVLLSPLINELMRAIIDFSDRQFIYESGSRTVRPIDNLEFLAEVWRVLAREFGDSGAREHLAEALFPHQTPEEWEPGDASPAAAR